MGPSCHGSGMGCWRLWSARTCTTGGSLDRHVLADRSEMVDAGRERNALRPAYGWIFPA